MKLAPGLNLPADVVTQTLAILAVRGAGKSNAAAVLAEELHAAELPFVVIDPVGAWWGLRSASDGRGPGLPVAIFGGRHGDVPLERGSGQTIADLLVEERLSAVLDVSEFSEGDKIRFLIDFGERLYRKNEQPLHLILEEADDYIPQRPMREQARLLRVFENIVRRGRARGLGITMVTQRSAALNKNVLTQIETLLVLRTTSPQDRKAIGAWIEHHAASRDLLGSLPELGAGEAWVWSPSFLKLMKRVQIRRRRTFDSGATPTTAKAKRRPATLADIDLEAVRARMTEAIERAKAEDPRELRARIAQLEREARQRPAAQPKVERVEVPVVKPADVKRLEAALARMDRQAERVGTEAQRLLDLQADVRSRQADLRAALGAATGRPDASRSVAPSGAARAQLVAPASRPAVDQQRPSQRPAARGGNGVGSGEVGQGGLRRILVALAQRPQGLSQRQLGVRAGLSSRSGTFSTYLGRARAAGWIDGRGQVVITDAGLGALGAYDPLPTGAALLDYWLGQLGGGGASRLLRAVAAAYPRPLSQGQAAEAAELSARSGTFSTYLSRLRALELVEGRAELRASAELFD